MHAQALSPSTSAVERAEVAEARGLCCLCMDHRAEPGSSLCRHCQRRDIARTFRLFGNRSDVDLARFYARKAGR